MRRSRIIHSDRVCIIACRRIPVLPLLVAALILFPAGGALGEEPTEPRHQEQETLDFSLAISGGVSLGTYESGVNWAFIRHLRNLRDCSKEPVAGRQCADERLRLVKPPVILAIAGASAGSVNALLSAAAWCLDDGPAVEALADVPNDIAKNVFKDTWLDVGVDELLPEDSEAGSGPYASNDLLLTRNAFRKPLARLKELLGKPIFRSDCDVPLAFTLTRIRPERISTAGITVNNSRFTLPVRLVSDADHPGRIRIISNIVDPADPYWGNIIFLPGARTREKDGTRSFAIEADDVVAAVLASSSYPLAFGNTKLTYCFPAAGEAAESRGRGADDRCPEGYELREQGDDFIDGGVFDNVPLGVARALAEPRAAEAGKVRRVNYIYIDPGNRRVPDERRQPVVSKASGTAAEAPGGGLRGSLMDQLMFLNGAVKTGLDYELYNVLRSGDWNHRAELLAEKFIADLKVPKAEIDPDRCRTDHPECSALFDSLPHDLMSGTHAGTRLHAAACLRNRSYELGNAFQDRLSDASTAQALRDEMTGWLRTLNKTTVYRASERSRMQHAIDLAVEDSGGERGVILSSRFSRITGDYLAHFGAFLDRQFRLFDYYTGVYDAVYGIVDFRCQGACDLSCQARETENLYRELGIGSDLAAAHVFLAIARKEHPPSGPGADAWAWIDQEKAANDLRYRAAGRQRYGPMDILQRALDQEGSDPDSAAGFAHFLRTIRDEGYHPGRTLGDMLERIDKSPLSMYYPLTARASLRLKDIVADTDGSNEGASLAGGARAGLLVLNTSIDDEQTVEFARSTVPPKQSWWWYVLPNELSADVANGGAFLSWEPRWNWSDSMSLNGKITPYVQDSESGTTYRLSQLDLYLTWKRKYAKISSIGIGPSVYQPLHSYQKSTKVGDHLGASFYLSALGDKIRLTVGMRNIHSSHYPAPSNNIYLLIGITDIPGTSYWLFSQ